jgi:protein pelota
MWHAYNLIAVDDYVKSSTIRRVTNETSSGSTNTNRVHTTLTICVKSIHFDTEGGVLSLNGTNVEENTYVKVKKYFNHSIFKSNFYDLYYLTVRCLSYNRFGSE